MIPYERYDGPAIDEVLAKPHFHNWYLGPMDVESAPGWQTVAYRASFRPYGNRVTATRYGRMHADPEYGKAGVKILKCKGGPACPNSFVRKPDDDEASADLYGFVAR